MAAAAVMDSKASARTLFVKSPHGIKIHKRSDINSACIELAACS